MEKKHIFTIIVMIFLSCATYYFSGIWGIGKFYLSLFLYSVVFYLIYFSWKHIRHKPYRQYPEYAALFLNKVSGVMVLILVILGGAAYYYNEYSPAGMPTFTMSNGEKTVTFQAMSHIGSRSFYDQIVTDLIQAKNDGFVYYFEGVRPGTPENSEKFNQAIGIEFNPELYKNFSKLYGVEYQNQLEFIGLVNDKDYNIDLSIDDIMEHYEEKDISEKTNTLEIPLDVNNQIIETLAQLNERQLQVLVYINQALLNIIIQSDGTQSFLTDNFANKALFDIILDKRNEVLAQEIITSEHQKIYTTYGLLHFKGVFQLLQENDPLWEILDTSYLYPIQ